MRSNLMIWFLLTGALSASAQEMSLSLDEARAYAVQHNTQMQTSQLNIADGRTTLQSRTSVGLPQLSASVGYNHFITLPTSLIPAEFFGGEPGDFAEVQFGTPENMTAGISASQLLFSGPYIYGVQAAKVYVELLQQQDKVTANDVKKNVELAYYTVLIAQKMAQIAGENLEVVNQTLHEVSEMNKAGFVEEIDVNRLEMTSANLSNMLANASRQEVFAKNLLKYQMGMDLSQEIVLTDSLEQLEQGLVLLQNDQNFLNRPEFQVMETTKRLNELNVQVNKSSYLPTLAVFGSYEQAAQRNEFNFFDGNEPWFETFLVGVQLNVPIFSGMDKKAAIESAQIGYDKAVVAEQTLKQSVQLEIAQYTTDYLNAKDDLATQQSTIELANKIFNTAYVKYREGLGSSLELTQAQGDLLAAQASYINALYSLLNAQTNLKKALGYL